MATLPTDIDDLSTTADDNYPAAGDAVAPSLDDLLRIQGRFIAENRDGIRQLVFNVKDERYGALGDDSTDDSTAINAAITAAKAAGGTVYIPPGIYRCKNLRLESGAKAWKIRGAGMNVTTLKHVDGAGNFLAGGSGSSVPYEIEDLTIDCQYSVYASASANNGISIADTSGVRIRRVRVKDYKEAGVLLYVVSETGGLYSDNVLEDCEFDGNGAANVGANIAYMDRSGYIRCRAINGNQSGSPGFGLQFKEDTVGNFMIDCYAEDWLTGFANGGTGSATEATVRGCRAYNCLGGLSGEWVKSDIQVIVDMQSAGQDAVALTSGSTGNRIVVSASGVAAAKAAVEFASGAVDNRAIISHFSDYVSGARAAIFESGALRNIVTLERTSGEPAAYVLPDLVSFGAAANANGFEIVGRETYEDVTIASGVATMSNVLAKTVRLDTEGAASTDDLVTLTHPAPHTGMTITLRSVANARDVVLKHGTGNLALHDGSDFTLSHADDRMVVSYGAGTTKWSSNGPGANNGA